MHLYFEYETQKLPIQWCRVTDNDKSSLVVNPDSQQTPSTIRMSGSTENNIRILFAEQGQGFISLRAELDSVMTLTSQVVYGLRERFFTQPGDEIKIRFDNVGSNLYNVSNFTGDRVLVMDTNYTCNRKSILLMVDDTEENRNNPRYVYGHIRTEIPPPEIWIIVVIICAAVLVLIGLGIFGYYLSNKADMPVLEAPEAVISELEAASAEFLSSTGITPSTSQLLSDGSSDLSSLGLSELPSTVPSRPVISGP